MTINAESGLLLIIDVQNDFCPAYVSASGEKNPAGALAVNDGGAVIPPLNALSASLAAAGGRVAATQDWHPRGHVSFASSHDGKKAGDLIDAPPVKGQALWPDHCVQGARGADFHDELNLRPVSLIIRKGFHKNLDSYSAFFENDQKTPTGLEGWIRGLGIKTVIMGGLATDYCVFFSAMDAKRLSFDVIIASDAVRGVGLPEGSVEKALSAMKDNGIIFASSTELLNNLQ
ncbi:MAG: bifunctional nicotinamidase/pyrazinamidase [Treponema sp.]|jgi:nicotinamidase/pyrazinamidase|nr:bifunctional nicotinamidase/pyrazinamidase [Treponema sp.]